MKVQGALLKGDEAGRALAAAAIKLDQRGGMASFHFRVELWPLPSLHREWVEASLYDERRYQDSFLAR